ncbi:MAG: hypothetical protein ACJA2D_000819 [Pseudohongiellaceae bacterium]|jgi:uncharacterized protein (TIGR02687 family)
MTEDRIQQALNRLFEKHRIVFWYDTKKELRADYERLSLAGVEKCEITDNEFTLKHRLLREQPKQNFLLYKEGPEPETLNNWLLDIQLSNTEFRTDQSAIWLSELELPSEFIKLVEEHSVFFEAAKRKDTLKNILTTDDTLSAVRLKMLATCASADPRADHILEQLLAEQAKDKDTAFKLICRCKLDSFLWQLMGRHYGYHAEQPSLKDFVIELFKTCYHLGVDATYNSSEQGGVGGDSLVFLKRWKDSRAHQQAFEILSQESAEILNIEADLNKRELTDLIEVDYFRLIDQRVISSLVREVAARTVSPGDVTLWCRQRRMGHWYGEFKHLYDAVDVASQFFSQLDVLQLSMPTATEAVQNYTRHWYKIDQLYRQYIYALKVSGQTSLLNTLTDQVENLYTNRFVLPLNIEWQAHVDAMDQWHVPDIHPQRNFFNQWVKRDYLSKDKKVCVIISDAFRYEAGEEMLGRIRQADRYQADLDYALSSLPSYTQLGMASLLPNMGSAEPNSKLKLADDTTGTAFYGEQSTQGTKNRDKWLKHCISDQAAAVLAKDVMELTITESRELLKANDVVYFYHNRIDHTGDKMQSEGEAFEAAEKTFDDLLRLIKKLTNANATNILITADHGFLYQNRPIEDSDFLSAEAHGELLYRDRRFLLGKGLSSGDGFKGFTAEQLGLDGDVGALIPKGIQRLRLQGSGSRFVHGGASLQEVVVPVIKINKKRQSDTSSVSIDILRSGSSVITSGQLAVTLYQSEAASEKVQGRTLRAGIYTKDNLLISDVHEVVMDLTAESPRERELKLRFVLTQEADRANGKEVQLRLEEPVTGTNHFKEYKTMTYTIRRSFTSDFDF